MTQTRAERLDGIRNRDNAAANDLLRTHPCDAVLDRRWLLKEVGRLDAEIEQLQVELGAALAPDDDPEPLTLRDIDPEAVYATEDDDFDHERAEAWSKEPPF